MMHHRILTARSTLLQRRARHFAPALSDIADEVRRWTPERPSPSRDSALRSCSDALAIVAEIVSIDGQPDVADDLRKIAFEIEIVPTCVEPARVEART